MQILRSIPRHLLRSPNFANSPAPMHPLSSPSRPLRSFIACPALRWWPPMLRRRSFPLMAAPNPPIHRVSQFSHEPPTVATISPVQGDESGKLYRRPPTSSCKAIVVLQGAKHSAITQGMKNYSTGNSEKMEDIQTKGAISMVDEYEMKNENDARRTILGVIDGNHDEWGQNLTGSEEDHRIGTKDHTAEIMIGDCEEYTEDNVLSESRHHDGSIYRNMDLWWKEDYRIADRNETRVKLYPSDCVMHNGSCLNHVPCSMLQIFSLELAKLHMDGGLVELYGYIAVRDNLEPLLNYVVNISRDDPITLEEGSFIVMVGPKRGIYMMDLTLLEYDMRIKTGEEEKDDLTLIDGASIVGSTGIWDEPSRFHISSDHGAVDITLLCIDYAVEATIEVLISEVQNRFSLSLGCLTSGLTEKIRLFDGAITESCGLKKYVVAVMVDSLLELKFKVGAMASSFDQHCCSFLARTHGHDTQEIKTDFALIMVKLTWSTLP